MIPVLRQFVNFQWESLFLPGQTLYIELIPEAGPGLGADPQVDQQHQVGESSRCRDGQQDAESFSEPERRMKARALIENEAIWLAAEINEVIQQTFDEISLVQTFWKVNRFFPDNK